MSDGNKPYLYDKVLKARESLCDAIQMIEGSFETKITYIGAGTITIALAFVSSISKEIAICGKWWFVLGVLFATAALTMNLTLYLIIKHILKRDIAILDRYLNEIPPIAPDSDKMLLDRIKSIDRLNWINLTILVLGIIMVGIFISINTL